METSRAAQIFLSVVFGILVGWSIKSLIYKHSKPIVKTETVIDTIINTSIDTIVSYCPVYKNIRIVDTVYVDRAIALPIEQKYYSKSNAYDLWVSGYSVNLDSIKTYNKTVDRYINTTTTTDIYKKSWNFYPYMGIKYFDSEVKPTIGLMIKSPKKWIIGGEFGLNSNNNTYYGVNIGYKIGK